MCCFMILQFDADVDWKHRLTSMNAVQGNQAESQSPAPLMVTEAKRNVVMPARKLELSTPAVPCCETTHQVQIAKLTLWRGHGQAMHCLHLLAQVFSGLKDHALHLCCFSAGAAAVMTCAVPKSILGRAPPRTQSGIEAKKAAIFARMPSTSSQPAAARPAWRAAQRVSEMTPAAAES